MAGALIAVSAGVSWAARRIVNPLAENAVADRVVVEKAARQLTLYRGGAVLKSYQVALGRDPIGQKMREGDGKTPEGIYTIDRRNPRSRFHKALHISYPTAQQTAEAAKRGESAGGDIMIHGLPNGAGGFGAIHRARDWTAGCIAVTNEEIEEIWRAVADGTVVEIRP